MLRARGVIQKPDVSDLQPLYKRVNYENPQENKKFSTGKYKENLAAEDLPGVYLSSSKLTEEHKILVARYQTHERPRVSQVAQVLEEIISAIEEGRDSLAHRKKLGVDYKNRYLSEKQQEDFMK